MAQLSFLGTYTVNSTYADYTAMASPGRDIFTQLPSFAATLDAEGYSDVVWYLVSGYITFTELGFTYECKSYFGSTIKGTYIGTITIEEPPVESINKSFKHSIIKWKNQS